MTDAIQETEIEDGSVFAEEDVGDEGADHWEEVRAHGEEVVDGHGLFAVHGVEFAVWAQEVGGHEDDEDALHAVEGEAFGEFIADDVGDTPWELGLFGVWGGEVLFVGHELVGLWVVCGGGG